MNQKTVLTPMQLFFCAKLVDAVYYDYAYLAAMPDVQKEYALHEQETMEELEDVKTAVSEAVTNAVIHGYSDEIGIIYIEARIEGEELIISVRDEGKGILNVEKAMEPMYTTDTTGERSGMGFSFMEAFMDEVEVESKVGCGTCVTMKKQIGRGYMNKEQEEKETAESYG